MVIQAYGIADLLHDHAEAGKHWITKGIADAAWAARSRAGDPGHREGPARPGYTYTIAGHAYGIYPALVALVLNLVVAVILSALLAAVGASRGQDETRPTDYTVESMAAATAST